MNRSEKVLKHLEKKYNEPFVIDESFSGGMDVKYDEFHCYPASNPDNRFAVYIHTDGDISDDYFGILAKPKYEELVRSKLDNYFNEYKVYIKFNERAFDDQFVDINQLSLYMQQEPRLLRTTLVVVTNNEDINENQFEDLCTDLKRVIGDFSIDIIICEENDYIKIDKSNYTSIIKNSKWYKVVRREQ